jgi:hypothetical protein
MTNLERKQADFETLNGAYMLLRRSGASYNLLAELLEHVNKFHTAYAMELHQVIADAVAGKEDAA